jgi:hypothetical protein
MILVPFAGLQEIKECSSTPVKIGLTVSEAIGSPGKSAAPLGDASCLGSLYQFPLTKYADDATVDGSAAAIFRRVTFPFIPKFHWFTRSYSVDVEGYANMARQAVLGLYSTEQPGVAIELADIRLFYFDVDGRQVEVVSDRDLCFAVGEYAGKSLYLISPLVKKEGHNNSTANVAPNAGNVSPVTSPSPPSANGALTETESTFTRIQMAINEGAQGTSQDEAETEKGMNAATEEDDEEAAKGTPVASVGASQTLGTQTQSAEESVNKSNEQISQAKLPPPLAEAMNHTIVLTPAGASAMAATTGREQRHPDALSLAQSLPHLAAMSSTNMALSATTLIGLRESDPSFSTNPLLGEMASATWALSDRMRNPSECPEQKHQLVKLPSPPAAASPILESNTTSLGLDTPPLGKRHHAANHSGGQNTNSTALRAMSPYGR